MHKYKVYLFSGLTNWSIVMLHGKIPQATYNLEPSGTHTLGHYIGIEKSHVEQKLTQHIDWLHHFILVTSCFPVVKS